jgi:hypothetical protein
VFEEFTYGDFNVNPMKYDEQGYYDHSPAIKSVPDELLNKVGFLAQLYLAGLPEWLLVDRDIRRNIALATYPRQPYKYRKAARAKAQLSTTCDKAPSVPFWIYDKSDQGKLDFLFTWNLAIQHHFWKRIRPAIPQMDVVRRCKCGKRSAYAVCITCQIKFLVKALREACSRVSWVIQGKFAALLLHGRSHISTAD